MHDLPRGPRRGQVARYHAAEQRGTAFGFPHAFGLFEIDWLLRAVVCAFGTLVAMVMGIEMLC